MDIHLWVNGERQTWSVGPRERLLDVLRREGLYSVKHGCETGECGACSVLLDGRPVVTCTQLAAQADGHRLETVESLSRPGQPLHLIQQAFVDTGAIQCGYCTPAMVMAALSLLRRNPNPTEAEARETLSGVLCRCTGYVKPVLAVLRAAAALRGQTLPPVDFGQGHSPPAGLFEGRPAEPDDVPRSGSGAGSSALLAKVIPDTLIRAAGRKTVGQAEKKKDALKLVKGTPSFTADMEHRGLLHGKLLTSPHAHARLKRLDTRRAEALPGVHAVISHLNVPRVHYASGGQSYPNPKPWDQVSFDHTVRYVGDRVAAVAAETLEIAEQALRLIEVEYEVLPAVFDPEAALQVGAPIVHAEADAIGIPDAQRNLVAHIGALLGDMAEGFAAADHIFEREYRVHQVQQAPIEPHVVMTWWDNDERLNVLTSTQVPFHVRRMLAPLVGLPAKRIRVIKPRIGGGFGVKQEMLIEDIAAHLTLATGRPVLLEFTRAEEFRSSRSRHPQVIRYKAGVKNDGTLTALDMRVVANTGAYGTHGLTVQNCTGLRGLSTYNCLTRRFDCDVAYTNLPVPGAYRGYGAPQAHFALESLMDEIAEALNLDNLEFRRKNWVKVGDPLPVGGQLGESASESNIPTVLSSGLEQCVEQGMAAIGWSRKFDPAWRTVPGRPHRKRGLGVAICMHGTAIPGLDMGAASLKLNDDGSFNLLVGATDLGTGSDTVLSQIAAEVLGVALDDINIYSSDTDLTPFDTGAYASSTTYISGTAVKKAAEQVRDQIFAVAAEIFKLPSPAGLRLGGRQVWTADGQAVSLERVGLHATHTHNQHQIMASASYVSPECPPPFAAQFAEVEVDTETGVVEVKQVVMAVDCGVAVNPATASGQVEGGMIQALGYGLCEEMAYDEHGRLLTTRFGDYRIFAADEMPEVQVILVETEEPSGPFGAKAVAEIPLDGAAAALANAVKDATGVRIRQIPLTPERVWRALRAAEAHPAAAGESA
ncbi:MAG: molybdopterin-dependent oxidoreductase [Anaerolineales bacterium]|nr:molybdopterin-dependent oxidoreductase [Anaerolineales bacterium]